MICATTIPLNQARGDDDSDCQWHCQHHGGNNGGDGRASRLLEDQGRNIENSYSVCKDFRSMFWRWIWVFISYTAGYKILFLIFFIPYAMRACCGGVSWRFWSRDAFLFVCLGFFPSHCRIFHSFDETYRVPIFIFNSEN